VQVWLTSNFRPLRLGEEKSRRKNKKKIETTAAKYNGLSFTVGGHKNQLSSGIQDKNNITKMQKELDYY